MRLISRPACAASLRQRCTSFSNSSSSAESFFNGWRSMPGTSPATSQFDWLISITAISVLSWSKAVRDRLRSFDCGMGHSIGLLDSAEGGMPSPLAPYHLPRSDPRPAHGGRDAVLARLHLDQERAAGTWARQQGAEALGAPQEAGAPAPARHASLPGRLEARLAAAGTGTRSCRHDGRR